jgi:hypothetical protein
MTDLIFILIGVGFLAGVIAIVHWAMPSAQKP